MIAPFAVDPFARPIIPPAAAPVAAPIAAPFSLLLSEAQPLSATVVSVSAAIPRCHEFECMYNLRLDGRTRRRTCGAKVPWRALEQPDDLSRIEFPDSLGARLLWQTGHRHDLACARDHETGARRGPHVVDRDPKIRRSPQNRG